MPGISSRVERTTEQEKLAAKSRGFFADQRIADCRSNLSRSHFTANRYSTYVTQTGHKQVKMRILRKSRKMCLFRGRPLFEIYRSSRPEWSKVRTDRYYRRSVRHQNHIDLIIILASSRRITLQWKPDIVTDHIFCDSFSRYNHQSWQTPYEMMTLLPFRNSVTISDCHCTVIITYSVGVIPSSSLALQSFFVASLSTSR